MPRDYIPQSDAEFDHWLDNFITQLLAQATTLGFLPAETTSLSDAGDEWSVAFDERQTARAAAQSATAHKRAARKAALQLVRPYVRRIQAHPAVDDQIRSLLQLTTFEPRTNPNGVFEIPDLAPLLQLDFGTRGQITVHFGPNPGNENRNGLPDRAIGAVLQVRSGELETGSWDWLDNPSSSPYVHIVQPAAATTLSYRCAYLYRRGRKGPWSATATATVTP
jgi:hypothetical protein